MLVNISNLFRNLWKLINTKISYLMYFGKFNENNADSPFSNIT